MIKTVFFDIDNTLYNFKEANQTALNAVADYAAKHFSMTPGEFLAINKKTQNDLNRKMGLVAASHNRLIRFQNILERQGISLHPHLLIMYSLYWDTLLEAASPYEGAEETMALLKEKGLKIGICTDMTALIQIRKLEKLKLLSYVDFMVSSEEAGAEKPAPVMFIDCARKAGCEPSECLMVGDSLSRDIQGAVNAGLQALWFCPEDNPSEAKGIIDIPSAAKIIKRLSQTVDFV